MKTSNSSPSKISPYPGVDTQHKDYKKFLPLWAKIRDCLEGEEAIKLKKETYLPRPSGMVGEYASAYDGYVERAHFPLILSYALSGALGVVISKLPEFNVPSSLEYIKKSATKDGRSLQQLFLDIIIEVFLTGRVPLMVDINPATNQFKFVRYRAENLINWKMDPSKAEKHLALAVLTETIPASNIDIFSHEVDDVFRVLLKNQKGEFSYVLVDSKGYPVSNSPDKETGIQIPVFMGKSLKKIPLIMAGSLNNSFDIQPIPLISVANCSIKIYRKEADLSNSEYISCNPTLCVVGASNDDDLPAAVGSSVMIVLPNEQARIFYTETDTAALQHVKEHIKDLYEEAIRHGVAILDARKGVEAAEALRIRQATQSASLYSIYLSTIKAIQTGLEIMCEWGGHNAKEIFIDAPKSLTQALPDPSLLKQMEEGFAQSVIPMEVIHRYLVASGMVDQTVNFNEYMEMLKADVLLKKDLGIKTEAEKEEDKLKADELLKKGLEDQKKTEEENKTKPEI